MLAEVATLLARIRGKGARQATVNPLTEFLGSEDFGGCKGPEQAGARLPGTNLPSLSCLCSLARLLRGENLSHRFLSP